ncbi:hypothetical protein [Nocardia camponoti]|nr:hypothetical protein [Nocardia camponoti]
MGRTREEPEYLPELLAPKAIGAPGRDAVPVDPWARRRELGAFARMSK